MKYFLVPLCFISIFAGSISCTVAEKLVDAKTPKFITRFPFIQLTGGVVIIRACITPYPDSLNFILDTGSGGISLDSSTVSFLQIPNEMSDRIIRGIAGMRKVKFSYNRQLKMPGITVDSLNFHINDYELLSGVYGMPINGIIGYSFLKQFIVRIDYDNFMIEVYEPGYYKYPKGGYLMQPTIAGLPVQSAVVHNTRDIESRFFLDTGAGLCLLFSDSYTNDSGIISPRQKRYNTVTEGLGGKKDMQMSILRQFKLGPYKFRKVPVYIFEDDYNITSYPHLAGLIGNDLLRRFNVIINYPHNEIHLLPNTHYRDLFDYTYTGLGLYTIDGTIVVSDIIQGSPADAAGLKEGDIVLGVDNNLSNNIQVYKSMLQSPGVKLRVIVRRNEEIIEAKISIKSIL